MAVIVLRWCSTCQRWCCSAPHCGAAVGVAAASAGVAASGSCCGAVKQQLLEARRKTGVAYTAGASGDHAEEGQKRMQVEGGVAD
jgi:hypothetical protein